jgi:hypothetical protein
MLVTVVLLSLSPSLVFFAHNLFYSTFLFFLPFAFAFYPYFRTKGHLVWFYFILGSLVALKSATGYEYNTSLILSSFVPVLYYELKEKSSFIKLLWKFIATVASSYLGFVVVMLTHFSVLSSFLGSPILAYKKILNRIVERTFGFATNVDWPQYVQDLFHQNYPQAYSQINSWLEFWGTNIQNLPTGLVSSMHYLVTLAVTIPGFSQYPYNIFLGSVLSVILLVVIVLGIQFFMIGFAQAKSRVFISAFAFFASLSWAIFGYSHMIAHPHINTIIFLIPFLPMAYLTLGVCLAQGLSKILQPRNMRN